MKAPEHFRPYSHEAAQQGAPIGLRNGAKVAILHVTTDKLIGMFTGVDETPHAGEWDLNGAFNEMSWEKGRMDIVMLPLGIIDGKPVFAGDVLEHCQTGARHEVGDARLVDLGHWRWPLATPIFPKTRMSDGDLAEAHLGGLTKTSTPSEERRHIINEGIARAIKDGDVVPAEMLGHAVRLTIDAGRTAVTWRSIDVVEIVKKVRSGAMAKAVG